MNLEKQESLMRCPECDHVMYAELLDGPCGHNYLAMVCPNCGHEIKMEG